MGYCFLKQEDAKRAFDCYFRALKIAPEETLKDEKLLYFFSLVNLNNTLENQLKNEFPLTIYYRIVANWLERQDQSEKAFTYYQKLLHSKPKPLLPSILFNTLPKSGSVYISNTLQQVLNLDFFYISSQGFVNDLFYPWSLKRLALGHGISQAHFFAYSENLEQISAFIPQMISHVRDPRQALLSWVHHINNLHDKGIAKLAPIDIGREIPDSYINWSFSQQLDWHIQHYYPLLIQWIESWVSAERTYPNLKILLTSYETFHQNPMLFFNQILTFYGLKPHTYDFQHLIKPVQGEKNFRKGSIDEWREVFTPKQQSQVNLLLKEDWLETFNWKN